MKLCVLEQDALLLLFTKEYKRAPARIEVDIIFEKAFECHGSVGSSPSLDTCVLKQDT